MCRVCKEAFKVTTENFLKDVATSIADGMDAEHFKDVLDAVLDTPEPVDDLEKDEAWEKGNRSI